MTVDAIICETLVAQTIDMQYYMSTVANDYSEFDHWLGRSTYILEKESEPTQRQITRNFSGVNDSRFAFPVLTEHSLIVQRLRLVKQWFNIDQRLEPLVILCLLESKVLITGRAHFAMRQYFQLLNSWFDGIVSDKEASFVSLVGRPKYSFQAYSQQGY